MLLTTRSVFACCLCSLLAQGLVLPLYCATAADTAAGEHFESEVLPILRNHCFECHSHESGDSSGGLMLDSLAAMTSGGSRGAAIAAGEPTQGTLMRAVLYADTDLQMPPDGKLEDHQIEILRAWIEGGAAVPEAFRGEAEMAQEAPTESLAEAHWAYQPPKSWPHAEGGNVIDAIVAAKLDEHSLQRSPLTPRSVLVRRLYYDLVGLPPTYGEVREFCEDPSDDLQATDRLVSRLLSSPHFGERWARYWMDLARYADNKGYVFREDREYAEAYRYRDWLVEAFNSDMPYDRFITLQIAGDIVSDDPADLPALGFLTLGRRFLNNKFDIVDDRLDVVTRGIMGMTLTCARCHDHKYDPLTQADYYALAGVFHSTQEPGGEPWPHRLAEAENPSDTHLLVRGSPGNRGEKIPRRFVGFLAPKAERFTQGSGRGELAEHLVDPRNPLTPRVVANRVWMQLTGASLVDSPSDFGIRCPEPVQRELLDQLAIELIEGDWSIKRLIRLIVTSETYRQSSSHDETAYALDPENQLYWKMNGRRLDFEALRDTLLSRSGTLDLQIGGKPVDIAGSPDANRRTVYSYIDRQNLPSLFRTFDFASPDTHSPQRAETSVPQQGLYLMNSDFVAHLAIAVAERAREEVELEAERAAWLFRQVLAREPAAEELQMLLGFVESKARRPSTPEADRRWICGYGPFDPAAQQLSDFKELPAFVDASWRGGAQLPDAELGWCLLNDQGGHPGNDLDHAVVRRWIAPRSGRIQIEGRVRHRAEQGDGVRASILHAGSLLHQATAHNTGLATRPDPIEVAEGDAVDFVTDCVGGPSHDSFEWQVSLRYIDGDGEQFQSELELPEPARQPLDAWQQLAAALLMTNELAYID